MHRPARAATLGAALAAAALLLASCGTSTGGPGGSATPPATPPLPATLDEATAAWAASGASAGEYRLRLVRSCFCPPVALDTTVKAGKVVDTAATSPVELGGTGAEVSADMTAGMPLTVPDLHALIAKEQPQAHVVSVTYDSQGVPVRLDVDPIENAVDDEYAYHVTFASGDVDADVPQDDGAWAEAGLPSGAAWGSDLPTQGNVQALLTFTGDAATLHVGLWGSSSCPDTPRTLTFSGTAADGDSPPVLRALVEVDATSPANTACTADYGPTTYAADVPDDVAAVLAPPTEPQMGVVLELVVQIVGGTPQDTTYSSLSTFAQVAGA